MNKGEKNNKTRLSIIYLYIGADEPNRETGWKWVELTDKDVTYI